MRELIAKGDPLLRIELPANIVEILKASAKRNKRSVQDEFIKRLNMTFKFTEALNAIQFDLLSEEVDAISTKWAQVIPLEMMQALSQASTKKGLSVGKEVLSRILATLKYPEAFGLNAKEVAILQRSFSAQEAIAECKRKHDAWMYIYEVEKLRLFLEFEAKLPRKLKENFMVIDVKVMSKAIKAELRLKKATE